MGFEAIPFSELLSEVVDNRGRTCPTADAGIPLIATNCIRNELLYPTYEKARFVSYDTYSSWFRGHPEPGDILFVNKATPGRVCLVPDPVDFCIAQDMVAVRADRKKVYPKYLFAALRSPLVQEQIAQMHVGTLIPHFKKGDFDQLLIPVPSSDEQRFIGDVYFELSARIDLNRRMNETLEGIPRAIFESWFVDFDPVRAKMEGRHPYRMDGRTTSLFPDSLADSRLGPIPRGWQTEPVGALVSLSREALNPGSAPDQVFDHYSIPAFDEGLRPIRQRGEEIRSNKLVVREHCVLLSRLNPRIPRVWLPLLRDDVRSICSTEFAVTVPNPPFTTEFIYGLFKSREFQETLATLVTGTSGSHQRVKPADLLDVSVLVPDPPTVRAFSELAQPFLARARANTVEFETLAALQETLLPRLISGEVRIRDAEQMAEAAL